MSMPDFLILGAQKAGTTSLYWYLDQHPQVFMSAIKEPHYFSFGLREPGVPMPVAKCIETREEYEALFQEAAAEQVAGEASASMLPCVHAPGSVLQAIPNARLIAILRDPAQRAHSQFVFNKKRDIETASSLHDVIELDAQTATSDDVAPQNYLEQGFYFKHLSRWLNHFDRSQLHICLLSDLRDAPIETMKSIFQHLGVDESFRPDVSIKYNVSGTPRGRLATWMIRTYYNHRPFVERVVSKRLISRVGRCFISPQNEADEERRHLIALYREDILALQDLIDRDLSDWLS